MPVPFDGEKLGLHLAIEDPSGDSAIVDLTNRIYYFNWAMNPSIIWVEVDQLDFSKGTPVKWQNPRNPELDGDITDLFKPAPK